MRPERWHNAAECCQRAGEGAAADRTLVLFSRGRWRPRGRCRALGATRGFLTNLPGDCLRLEAGEFAGADGFERDFGLEHGTDSGVGTGWAGERSRIEDSRRDAGGAVRKPAAALRTPRRARTGVGGGHVEARDDHARPSPPRRPVRAPPSVRRASRVVRTARQVRAQRSRTAPRRPRARRVTGDIASQQSRDCMPTEVSDAAWCYRSWVTCFHACGIGAPREGVRGSCRGRPRGGDAAGENDNGPEGVPPGPTRIGRSSSGCSTKCSDFAERRRGQLVEGFITTDRQVHQAEEA